MNGSEEEAPEKKEKLGEALLWVLATFGGCVPLVVGPDPAATVAELAAAFIAAGYVGGVSEDVRWRVTGAFFPLKLIDFVMLTVEASEAGVA